MSRREHALQRNLVVASLLIVGEDPRPLRELAIDPGTYTPSAVPRSRRSALDAGALLDTARGLRPLTPNARSAR